MDATAAPLVFDYLSSREFLGDYLAWAKDHRPGFTHRALLEKLGVTSTGFLSNVLSGKSNLNPRQARELAGIFDLPPAEAKYFLHLVSFTQARGIEEKGDALDGMRAQARLRNKALDPRHYSLFSKWLYPLVFELAALVHVTDSNHAEVAACFETGAGVKPADIEKALETLAGLDLLRKGKDGRYRQTHSTLKTGDEIASTDVVKYQQTLLKKAIEALDRVPPAERTISATTLPFSPEGLELAKQEARRFRDKLLEISAKDSRPDRVYLLNLSLFPGTRRLRGEKT